MENPTRDSLILRARDHDTKAWNQLVDLYAPLILQWCRRAALDEDDVADAFQEVFQSVAQNLSQFHRDRPGSTFRGWLRVIARNKVNDLLRRRTKEPRGAGGTEMMIRIQQVAAPTGALGRLQPPDADADFDDDPQDEAWLLRRALAQIRPYFHERTWRAFERTVIDGQSPAFVAEELSMSQGAVRVSKSRVLNRMRLELGDRLE